MKIKSLILFVIFSLILVSCNKDMKWINPDDSKADQSEIGKICEEKSAECGQMEYEYLGKMRKIFCGECENGYDCNSNKCQDIDECADPSLNNCNKEVSTCANEDGTYSCICKENYSGDDCVPDTRLKDCEGLPENAAWNQASRVEQTWNGSEWAPSNSGTFSEEESQTECRFKCLENYNWNGEKCEPATRTANCSELPAGTDWNTVSEITQTWSGSEWLPPLESTFNELPSTKECRYKCALGYHREDSACVSNRKDVECTGLPEHASWNTVSAITQTWTSANGWQPSNAGVYNETESQSECRFKCKEHYDWNESTSTCVAATQTVNCDPKPENTVWNDNGQNGTVTQEWDGEKWEPATYPTEYTTAAGNCKYICDSTHGWESGNCIDQKTADCPSKPANTIWNDNGADGIFIQIWNGDMWFPATHTSTFSKTPGECNFKCTTGHIWNNSECIETPTRVVNCTGLPANATWNSVESITQTWDGENWEPSNIGTYNTAISTTECHFKCTPKSVWDDSKCILQTALGNICTGQNKCFDDSYGEISCPMPSEDFYGQDAQYAILGICEPQNLTIKALISSEKIVVDNNTGLEWQQTFPEETYLWRNAKTYCENLNYGGYSDWRLPSAQELLSIFDISYFNPAIKEAYFPNTPTGSDYNYYPFWSSSSSNCYDYYDENYGNTTGAGATTVAFGYGGRTYCEPLDDYQNNGNAPYSQYVRCVRGSALPSTSLTLSTIDGDKIVVDKTTDFIWQKEYRRSMNWQEALDYCENLNYAGYDDWRLPNRNELLSLINYNRYKPASDFPDAPLDNNNSYYPELWSSSTYIHNYQGNYAFSIDFNNGYINFHSKDERLQVHCVHNRISSCENINCANIENSTGTCTENAFVFSCGCITGYAWDGSACAEAKASNCKGLPENAHWNSVANITQIWDGLEWLPTTIAVYNEKPSNKECRFKCNDGYFWNNSKCVLTTPLGNICTGQNKCYNNEGGEINCPTSGDLSGQDAQYAELGKCKHQSFTINNSIVKDNNTGLEWQQIIPNRTFSWEEAKAYCEDTNYSGYNDWRLPTAHELMTIIDHNQSNPAIDTDYFPNTPSSYGFWSSSIRAAYNTEAWGVYNWTHYFGKYEALYVRCLRGPVLPETNLSTTLTLNEDKIVTDSTTGLIWQKDYATVNKTWQEALDYCENLDYAGYDGWRLPNKNELASLANYGRYNPASDFPDIPSNKFFWSSSTDLNNPNFAYSIDFYESIIDRTKKDYFAKTICVHDKISSCESINCDIDNSSGICTQNAIAASCNCVEGYAWDGFNCAETKVSNCEGLPDNATWNTVPSIDQILNGTEWLPTTTGAYNEIASNRECRFKCNDGYFWNGENCIDPCNDNVCENDENSTKVCIPQNAISYSCECIEGHFWNDLQCVPTSSLPNTLGRICTGQNTCSNNSVLITCPTSSKDDFFGQDAQYAELGMCKPQSYSLETISGKKIVKDNNTNLWWQYDMPERTYTWDEANTYCENTYAGYSDWRLPTVQELLTIVDNGQESDLAIDTRFFPELNKLCWSSATSKENSYANYAWGVYFSGGGSVNRYPKSYNFLALCVRGTTLPTSSFSTSTINGNDVVIDSSSNLIWQKDYVKYKTWQEALAYCENLTYAGYSNWRLPNKNELLSIINYDKDHPASDFPDMSALNLLFWVSTTPTDINHSHYHGWIINLNTGEAFRNFKTTDVYSVRCVR